MQKLSGFVLLMQCLLSVAGSFTFNCPKAFPLSHLSLSQALELYNSLVSLISALHFA